MAKDRGGRKDRIAPDNRRDPLAMEADRAPRDRSDEEREDDGFALSQDEREQMLRDDALQNTLPIPPKKAGVHWFWGSLTNPYTPIEWYMRLGWKPVKFEELAGWANANMRGKSGEYAGCITVNEMVLMRGDETAYQRYMRILHHEKPMQEQERMRQSMRSVEEAIAAETGQDGLVEDVVAKPEHSGLRSLDRRAKRPTRFD